MELTNQYNEKYKSYLGAGDAASGLDDDRYIVKILIDLVIHTLLT